MNYRKIYNNLVNKAKEKGRVKNDGCYYESHHIIPRCFGGQGDGRNINHPNIVLLTTKEHYVAHLLLAAIYPESPAMSKALWSMCHVNPNGYERYKPGSRMYEYIRNDYIKNCSGIYGTFYGKNHSEESKLKIGLASKGRQTTLGFKHSDSTRRKMSEARTGKIFLSEETKQKISLAIGGGNHYKAKKIICLKTGTVFGSGKELSEFLNIPFSTIRRWLNGTSKSPITFHYKRI